MGACSLSKYFGIALIPLLLVYTLIRNGKPGWWLFYFLIPLAMIGSYEGAMCALYGHGQSGMPSAMQMRTKHIGPMPCSSKLIGRRLCWWLLCNCSNLRFRCSGAPDFGSWQRS